MSLLGGFVFGRGRMARPAKARYIIWQVQLM
jgi:hypothetical protein